VSTIITGIADPHFSDKKPRSRRDNYQETQIRKMTDLINLSKKIKWDGEFLPASAITIAGDICHQPRGELISRRLDIRLISTMAEAPCPILAILGNHDKEKDRIESIETHTLGTMVASKTIRLVHWPDYVLVGDDPPVIVTGRQYTVDGPGAWLDHLRTSRQLLILKESLSQQLGKKVFAFVMTHCNWGQTDGALRGDPVIGHPRVLGTGCDVMFYGHPHTDDGIVELDDQGTPVWIIGPGAFTRGTIAEHDVNREPKILISVFHSDKQHEMLTVPIPHEPASVVFDLQGHARVKQVKEAEERFMEALSRMDTQATTPEEVIEAAKERTPARVVALSRSYIAMAEASVNT